MAHEAASSAPGAASSAPGAVFLATLLLFCAAPAMGQTSSAKERTPAPYEKEEFPEWLREIWRAEVVFVGSFPFTLFFTLEGYDTYRYMSKDFNSSYAPWPFRSAAEITYTTEEKTWLLVSALAGAALVSLVDFILGHVGQQSENP
jgi:hypothetical protein